jgi:peptidoglycan/LPS O-acetylase OafA/YrhL
VLSRELRAVLWLFAALAFSAGVLLYVLSGNTDDTFSWTIAPSLTAAFLGAAYWAALVLFVWSARQTVWARARPFVLPVGLIAVLLLVATLTHDDKFHKDLFGRFWLVAYIAVPPLLAYGLWRQSRAESAPEPPREPLAAALRLVLVAEALVLVGVGIALFVAPETSDDLWPWTLTPLTARAIASFLIGFGAAAAQAAWENDMGRLAGSAYAYATLGLLELVAVLRYPDELDGSGLRGVLYVAFVVLVLITGVAGSVRSRRPARLQRT